ncbi:FAD-dependent oxidoreductase [Acaricomes phytoseiuli]|uniref:FAD-dependent oxidoreductase n=1 Tax=Acaricomes phytoseiuli TaxID=291968 RepID=UPI0005BAB0FE|nr:FAD-dependent oxidoreductase [Acaricomes phytoseiuli]
MYQVIVIGAGQAGLSAAYHLQRKGLRPAEDFLVLDSNSGPGGAWRHRWPSLTLGAAHGIHDLPSFPLSTVFPEGPGSKRPASEVVAEYYAAFEAEYDLQVQRPDRVLSVSAETPGAHSPLTVRAGTESFAASLVINATGTWDKPYWPYYPGAPGFIGRQLHTHDFRSAAEFTGQRVLVVGGGTSAAQFLLQLHDAGAQTVSSTRREPHFTPRTDFVEWGRDVERKVNARTSAGLPPISVVGATGLPLTPEYQRGIDQGTLISRGLLDRLERQEAVFADGSRETVDAVLWATGFRATLDHLAPLRLREPGGGIRTDSAGVGVAKEPRLLLVGYGASASTLGATRAGRSAALLTLQRLRAPVHDDLPVR